MASERPDTVAGILEWTAEHLDRADELVDLLAEKLGKDFRTGTSVQKDLRIIAKVLQENPHIDNLLYSHLLVENLSEEETT